MITKEDYRRSARIQPFLAPPVELFDKLAVLKFMPGISLRDKFYFMQEIGGAFFFWQRLVRIEQFDSSDQFSYMDYIKKGALFPLWWDVPG